MWCNQTVELRCNPETRGFNFCCFCGKSWFNRLQCRDHEVPRWYYNRWGNGEGSAPALWKLYNRPKPTATWVIEKRIKWFDDPWGKWEYEFSSDKDPCNPDWQWAKSILEYHRGLHEDDHQIKYEYRARIEKRT